MFHHRREKRGSENEMNDACGIHHQRASALLDEGRYKEAFSIIELALEDDPECVPILALAGDVNLLYSEELGLDSRVADLIALDFYNRALALEPQDVDVLNGKALALLYLGRPDEALSVAEEGFSVLPLRVGYAMTHPDVYRNAEEALFDRKIRALLALGRRDAAREVFADALEKYPKNEYLTRHMAEFLP